MPHPPAVPAKPALLTAGDELRALLSPVSPGTFVHEYWGSKPLFVKGTPDKFRGLFDRGAFVDMLERAGPSAPDFLRASFDKRPASATGLGPAEVVSTAFDALPHQALPLFEAGATLCATQVEARVPHLAPFVAAIKRQLGYPGRATFNAYLSPPGAGFNWHFDSRIASTLQLEGSKRWRFSRRPAVAWPRFNGVLRTDGSGQYVHGGPGEAWERIAPLDLKETDEALLEPGDLLVLPAGVWHDARGGEGGSLALNLSFTPVPYTTLVHGVLDALLLGDPTWRGPAPLLPAAGGEPGQVDPRGLAAVAAALAKAADSLRATAADATAMVEVWSSFVQATGFGVADLRSPAAALVERKDRLRVRADGNVYARLAEGGARLCLFIGAAGRVDATGADIALVRRVLATRSFAAADCLAWGEASAPIAWEEVQAALTGLLREGVLEREDAR